MRRYAITLGAPSTAGGRVSSAGSDVLIDGQPVALEGDSVACPACGGSGKILCVGPRIPETWHGRQIALEHDLCTCRCSPLPRLLATQTRRCQVLKDTGHALSQVQAAEPAPRGRLAGHGRRLLLLDAHTGVPLAHREYAVVRQGGRLEFGTSDASGRTHLLARAAGMHGYETCDVYL